MLGEPRRNLLDKTGSFWDAAVGRIPVPPVAASLGVDVMEADLDLAFATPTRTSMEAFLSVSAASRYQVELEDCARSLLRQGHTQPGWCLIGLRANVPVARAALWAPAGESVPTNVVLIEVDWSEEHLATGRALLDGVHELASELGAESLCHSVDDPPASPQYQENGKARNRLMTSSGYELLGEGQRWRYAGPSHEEELPGGPLGSLPLREVREDTAMAKAFERAGYEPFGRRRVYRRALDGTGGSA
jgi:hypothetical protein